MASEDQDEGLYNDVMSAYKAAEELQEDNSSEPEASTQPEDDVVRDETGRFAAKQKEEVGDAKVQAVEEQPAPTSPVELSTEKPPQSWTPAAREKWSSLDPEIRKEIIRREEASANGVRQMQERFAPAGQFIDQMRPVAAEAQAIGADPVSYIHNLAMSERTLRTADLPTKFNELMRIADQYGIPLRDVINKSVGQEVLKAPQQTPQMQLPPQIQQELNEIRQWRAQAEQQQANALVQTFGEGKEFLHDVKDIMADLIERGLAPDLPTAYDQACWMVPEVRQVLLARQGQQASSESVALRQKQAAGSSIPASGKVAVSSDDSDDEDISATVRKAFIAAQGRN